MPWSVLQSFLVLSSSLVATCLAKYALECPPKLTCVEQRSRRYMSRQVCPGVSSKASLCLAAVSPLRVSPSMPWSVLQSFLVLSSGLAATCLAKYALEYPPKLPCVEQRSRRYMSRQVCPGMSSEASLC